MLRTLAFVLVLITLAPVALASPAQPSANTATTETVRYRALEKLLRKFSRQAGEPARVKIYAQR